MSRKVKVSPYVAARIQRRKDDFRVDTFCAGGKGGSNQNANQTGVRVVDKITGLSAECREERYQVQNKSKAFHRLCDRLVEHYRKEEFDSIVEGSHDSQLWIRTYKEKNDLVIDRRLPGQSFSYKRTLNGQLDDIIEELVYVVKETGN